MTKDDVVEIQGRVIDVLPNATFKVELEGGRTVLGIASGKIRKNRIYILEGDNVTIEFSPYDLTKGRITRRLDQQNIARNYR